jgi:diguanylate cyclase
LSNASELVRHDLLTGALNRKGLDEALEKEIAPPAATEAAP